VILDFSGLTSIDGVGCQATIKLMDAVYIFGGRFIVREEPQLSVGIGTRSRKS
jgi:hypothetical protein